MKAAAIAACALALSLCACGSAPKPAPAHPAGRPGAVPEANRPRFEDRVLIRLRNTSDTLELRAAFAIFPEDTVLFGDLPARGYSEYHAVRKSYRYGYLRVQAAGREWTLQPADFVGEKLLGPGRYTWEIKPHDGPYPGFLDFEGLEDKGMP